MDIKALTRQIKEKERILFKELIRVNNACLEKYKSDYFRDLPYQAQKQAVALVCGGWIRDKVKKLKNLGSEDFKSEVDQLFYFSRIFVPLKHFNSFTSFKKFGNNYFFLLFSFF